MQGRFAKGIQTTEGEGRRGRATLVARDTFVSSAPAEHLINRTVINDASTLSLSADILVHIFKSARSRKNSLIKTFKVAKRRAK